MFNWILFSSFIFSLAMTLLGMMVDLSYRFTYEPQVEKWKSSRAAQLEDYLEDENKWKRHNVFGSLKKEGKDLNLLLEQIEQGDLQKPLVDPQLKKEILSMGKEWIEEKHKIKKVDPILDFFTHVEDYNFWTPIPPLQKTLATDLIVANQIYLAYTFHFKTDDVRAALRRTRHLSKILLNTEYLNLKKAGLSLLEKEHVFLKTLNNRFLRSQVLWTPISSSVISAYRNHIESTSEYLSLFTPPDVIKTVFLKADTPFAFCPVMKKKLPLLLWGREYLSPQFIFEPSFKKTITTMDGVIAKARSQCPQLSGINRPTPSWAQLIPYYRRLYAVKFVLNAEKNRKFL